MTNCQSILIKKKKKKNLSKLNQKQTKKPKQKRHVYSFI